VGHIDSSKLDNCNAIPQSLRWREGFKDEDQRLELQRESDACKQLAKEHELDPERLRVLTKAVEDLDEMVDVHNARKQFV